MAQRWSFEEDYIVGKYCLKKPRAYGSTIHIAIIKLQLTQAGFQSRSEYAIQKRARIYGCLFLNEDIHEVPCQVRTICNVLLNRDHELYANIIHYIKDVYDPDVQSELKCNISNSITDTLSTPNESIILIHTIKYDSTFPMVLEKYVVLKKLKKHNAMCKRIGMKPDTFSAILRGKYKEVKKENVLKICVGLELSVNEAEELLNSAGYMFSNAIMTDVVVKAFLWNRIYSVVAINAELYENNAPMLFKDYIIEI
jgi:DNA-binding Xre family transcriptional regulator